jgi:hypothetical protein
MKAQDGTLQRWELGIEIKMAENPHLHVNVGAFL